jgi:putative spermidine/putrescine transport system permease protein
MSAVAADIAAGLPSRPGLLSGDRLYWVMLLVPGAFMSIFYLLPVANVLALSFTSPTPGIANYVELVSNPAVLRVLATTARICLLTTAIVIVVGYLVSYALLGMGERQRRLLLVCVVASFWVSALIRAFAWVAILQPRGVVNSVLMGAGLIDTPLTLVRNEFGVVIGMVHYMLPYAILPLFAAMQGIDARLVAAARTLGASRWFAFSRVFFPLSIPGLVGAGLLVLIFSLGFYVTPAILGGGKTMMIAEYISVQISETLRWGLAAALSSTLLASVLILTVALMRFMDVGGSVKH